MASGIPLIPKRWPMVDDSWSEGGGLSWSCGSVTDKTRADKTMGNGLLVADETKGQQHAVLRFGEAFSSRAVIGSGASRKCPKQLVKHPAGPWSRPKELLRNQRENVIIGAKLGVYIGSNGSC
jgi:hypothetical protein